MIKDLKEFEKFLKLCRKQGLTDVEFDGVKVKFGDLPTPTKTSTAETEEDVLGDAFPSQDELDELTGIPKMAFFSSEGGSQQ